MNDKCLCLHCEISDLLQRRQRAGVLVSKQTFVDLARVFGDIVRSAQRCDRADMAVFAIEALSRELDDAVAERGLYAGPSADASTDAGSRH